MVAGDMHILFHVEHECAEYCGKVVKRTPQIILIYRARIISELIKRKREGPQLIMIYSDYQLVWIGGPPFPLLEYTGIGLN